MYPSRIPRHVNITGTLLCKTSNREKPETSGRVEHKKKESLFFIIRFSPLFRIAGGGGWGGSVASGIPIRVLPCLKRERDLFWRKISKILEKTTVVRSILERKGSLVGILVWRWGVSGRFLILMGCSTIFWAAVQCAELFPLLQSPKFYLFPPRVQHIHTYG